MPIAKYCPQCGTMLVSRAEAGRSRPVCPHCGYVVYINPTVAVGTLVEKERRVLLVRRAVEPRAGYWGLPAGYVEADETTEEAAIRETREETNLEVVIDGLLHVYSYGTGMQDRGVLILYAASVIGGQLRAGDDALEAAWFSPESMPSDEEIAFKTHRQALDDWRRIHAICYQPATPTEAVSIQQLAQRFGEAMVDFLADVEQPRRALIAATDRGQVVGFARIVIGEDQTAWLTHLFVIPDYRRWGIGTRLIERGLAFVQQQGIRLVMTKAPASNPAIAFYLKVGFRLCGFWDRPDPYQETVLFLAYEIPETR